MIDNSVKSHPCPTCGKACPRHSHIVRNIKDFDGVIQVRVSRHFCNRCKVFCTATVGIAAQGQHYSDRVRKAAVAMFGIGRQGKDVRQALSRLGVKVPMSTLFDWKEVR